MKNNKIKSMILIVTLLVAVIIPKPNLNAYTTTPNTEIVYFDYKGIYLTPDDYKNGVALTYNEYYSQAFGDYVNSGIMYFRSPADFIKVIFIPMNYIEVEGFSGYGIDKLDMLEVGYRFHINSYDVIEAIELERLTVYTKDLYSSNSYVNVTVLDSSFPVGPVQFINGIINQMPDIELEHQEIYDRGYYEGSTKGFSNGSMFGYDTGYKDGVNGVYINGFDGIINSDTNEPYDVTNSQPYNTGYNDGVDDGFDDGFIQAVNSVYHDGFGGFINPDTNEFYDVTYSYPYGQGYDKGYNEGVASQSDFSFTGILFQVFAGLGALLTIELLPNITIGAIVAVPLVFGIIYFILGKRSGE